MKSFKNYINEAFDKPYAFSIKKTGKINRGSYKLSAKITLPNNDLLDIELRQRYVGGEYAAEIEFTRNGRYSMSHTGDGLRVMSTVLEFIRRALKLVDKEDESFEKIIFSADKEDQKTPERESGRAKLYTRMIKKYMPNNWNIEYQDSGDSVRYTFTRK
jgi:hypothetical protein